MAKEKAEKPSVFEDLPAEIRLGRVAWASLYHAQRNRVRNTLRVKSLYRDKIIGSEAQCPLCRIEKVAKPNGKVKSVLIRCEGHTELRDTLRASTRKLKKIIRRLPVQRNIDVGENSMFIAQAFALETERIFEKVAMRFLAGMPIMWNFLLRIKGVGPRIGCGIVSLIGDIRRFASVRGLWAYADMHVVHEVFARPTMEQLKNNPKLIEVSYRGVDTYRDGDTWVLVTRTKDGETGAVTFGEMRFPPDRFLHIKTYAPHRIAGERSVGNTKLKTLLFKFSTSILKQRGSAYRAVYDAYRDRTIERITNRDRQIVWSCEMEESEDELASAAAEENAAREVEDGDDEVGDDTKKKHVKNTWKPAFWPANTPEPKPFYGSRPEWTLKRVMLMSLRYVSKEFLKHIFYAWHTLDGISVAETRGERWPVSCDDPFKFCDRKAKPPKLLAKKLATSSSGN